MKVSELRLQKEMCLNSLVDDNSILDQEMVWCGQAINAPFSEPMVTTIHDTISRHQAQMS